MASHPSAGLVAVYETRRQRTLAMTLASIQIVQKAALPISLSSIAAASRRIDPVGKGISSSAILRNAEAYSHYQRARAWKAPVIPRPRAAEPRNPFMLPVKTGRRESASRHRLSRLTKSELVERLLEIQNAYATVRAAWLELQGRILSSGSKSVQRKHIHSKLG